MIVADDGSFDRNWTELKGLGDPADEDETNLPTVGSDNSICGDVYKKFGDALELGDFNVYTVPAQCAYKVTVKIAGGGKKVQKIWLIPGCELTIKVKGDLVSNKLTTDSKWSDAMKKDDDFDTSSKPPEEGKHKCGKLTKSGMQINPA